MAKKILGIDIDGTLADSISPWLREAERSHGIKAAKSELLAYHLETIFTAMTKEQVSSVYKYVWSKPDSVGLEDQNIPSILENIHQIFDIYITTAASGEKSVLKKWLHDNGIPYDKLLHFKSSRQKHEIPEVDVYIDDFEEVAESVASSGRTVILLRQPWNDQFIKENKNPRILIAYNWREIEQILLEKFR